MHRSIRALLAGLLLAAGAASAAAPEWLLYLKDGRVLRGEIVDRDAERLTVVVAKTGEKVVFDEALLRRAEGPPLPPRCQAGDGRALTATLKDGRVVAGALQRRCEGGFTLAPAEGEPVPVRDDEVASLSGEGTALPPPPGPVRSPWRADVASARLLASPTALAPRAGDLVLSTAQHQLSLEAGITPWLSVAASTTPTFGYARDLSANATLSLAAGTGWRWLHGRGGLLQAFGPGGPTTTHLFGSVTAGGPDGYLTAYAGPPLPGAALAGAFGDRILSVGGAWRFASWAALSTEHWVALDGGSDTAHALALRMLREPLALEVGGVLLPGRGDLLPWVGLSWRLWRFE